MMKARLHVCSNYLANQSEFDGVSEYIAEFIEELGGYVRIGAVSDDVMWEAHSWYVEHYYCMFRGGIDELRKLYHDDTLYQKTDELFRSLAAVSKSKQAPGSDRGELDLRRFAENEVKVAKAFLDL